MDCDRSLVLQCDQMRSIADSLKPIGSRFDNEISYEINGCILTWIANDSGLEHRFDCSNIIEIIDGYYKAEFYLDTKRIFEVPELIENYTNITDIKLTGYTQDQDDTNHISKNVSKKPNSTTKIDTISNASTDADSLNENNNSTNTNNNNSTSSNNTSSNTDSTPSVDSETVKQKVTNLEDQGSNKSSSQNTNKSTNQSISQSVTPSTNQLSNQYTGTNEKQNPKQPTNVVTKTMETRNSSKISLTLRSSKPGKNTEKTKDIYNKNTAKTLNCYSRIPQNDLDTTLRQSSEVKKRKISKTVNIPVPSLT